MYHHKTYTHLYSMKTAAGAASPSIYLCNNKGNSVSVTPVSCQIKILVSVCHLPENFCTLSMTRSILTVPFAFLINVSSLILSWLLILPFPTHCTKVKDTVHYYTVTYMLLILPTMTVRVGIAVLGTDMPKLTKQDLLVSRVS